MKTEPIKLSQFTNKLHIEMYAHCGLCLAELPPDKSPQKFASISVGFTHVGLQVWCNRHECNIMHIDFQGHQHPAITSR